MVEAQVAKLLEQIYAFANLFQLFEQFQTYGLYVFALLSGYKFFDERDVSFL